MVNWHTDPWRSANILTENKQDVVELVVLLTEVKEALDGKTN